MHYTPADASSLGWTREPRQVDVASPTHHRHADELMSRLTIYHCLPRGVVTLRGRQ